MKNDDDFIDKMYSEKLGNFKSPLAEEEWNKLSSKLARTNFIKFSFTTFNIYYLAMLLTFAGTSTYFGIRNYKLTEKIKILENDHKPTNDSENHNDKTSVNLATQDSVMKNAETKSEINSDKVADIQRNSSGNNIRNDVKTVDLQANPSIQGNLKKADSIRIKVDTVSENTISTKIKRIKKTVFVKKDAVIIKDTVVVKK